MIQFLERLEDRPSFSVPSFHHQTILSKTIFEHFTTFVEVSIVALASKSIQNSSLAPNFVSKICVAEDCIDAIDAIFHPSSALPMSFLPAIAIEHGSNYKSRTETEYRQRKLLLDFVDALKNTKYFCSSISDLEIHNCSFEKYFLANNSNNNNSSNEQ